MTKEHTLEFVEGLLLETEDSDDDVLINRQLEKTAELLEEDDDL